MQQLKSCANEDMNRNSQEYLLGIYLHICLTSTEGSRSRNFDMDHVEEFVRLFGPCVNPFNGLLNVFYGQHRELCFMETRFYGPARVYDNLII